MADDIKISALPAVVTPSISDVFPVVQGGVTKRETIAQALSLIDPVPLSKGGTNANLTASNGGIFYSTATAGAILSGTATAGQIPRSGSNAAPSWSTATYPATTTINRLLFSSTANVISDLATANSSMLSTNSTGVPAWTASLTNGQFLIGSTGGTPSPASITAGTNISITNGANSIIINATGHASFTWAEVTETTQSMAVNTGYISNNASLVTCTLPTTSAVGDTLRVVGKGAGGWGVILNSGQSIRIGDTVTTVSSGSIASSESHDAIHLVCTTANTVWTALNVQGQINFNTL